MLHFGRFGFDAANVCLEDASGPIHLNPKAFDVLRVLVEHRGDLVAKQKLLDEVWPDTHVADGVLMVCMTEIRTALADSARKPRFIETVHKRGYRFIATVTDGAAAGMRNARDGDSVGPSLLLGHPAGDTTPRRSPLVGRSRELDFLEERLAGALNGQRQVVFVTGEPGAGKTALVERFIASVARHETLAITRGQSLGYFGSTEPYMPVLEAIGRLVRDRSIARSLLRRYAPTWFVQLPWLVEDDDRERLGRELLGATRDRMLRELGEFVEALGIPLILVLEDLHWSDPSTVDLLSLIASRREPARLLLLATYRPVEAILAHHPLRAAAIALVASGRASELAVDNLGAESVSEYLERRFAGNRFPPALARMLHERTAGNPLFMVSLVDHLCARGAIDENGLRSATRAFRDELATVPETLRVLIERHLERLAEDDRKVLEAASLAGLEFSAAAAAAGADCDVVEAEERCERLANTGFFLRRAGTGQWPDGTVARKYVFRHALHRETLVDISPLRQRAESHLRIARAIERSYGDGAAHLAVELAVHFEAGGDRARAVDYRRLAAQTAGRRYAFAEAETHLERGLALNANLPASGERDRSELSLQSALGSVCMATRGYGAPKVERAHARVLELASNTHEPAVFPAVWGLWNFCYVRIELDRALELALRAGAIAAASDDRVIRLEACQALWATHFFRGGFAETLDHIANGEPFYDHGEHVRYVSAYGHDPKVSALAFRTSALWTLGRIDLARAVNRQTLEHARSLGEPRSLVFAMIHSTSLQVCRRDPGAYEQAEAAIDYACTKEMPHWIAVGRKLKGCALVEQGILVQGIAELEAGFALSASVAGTDTVGDSYMYAVLAAAKTRAGELAEGRALMEHAKALVAANGERYRESEIHRLDAELVLVEAGGLEKAPARARERAEHLLRSAVEWASSQGARTLELRAATALARLSRRSQNGSRARAELDELLGSFAEGFDTEDLKDARRALEESTSQADRPLL
jgi:DNA-binding winged helix-turn-helix (wHTH) protein